MGRFRSLSERLSRRTSSPSEGVVAEQRRESAPPEDVADAMLGLGLPLGTAGAPTEPQREGDPVELTERMENARKRHDLPAYVEAESALEDALLAEAASCGGRARF